jgi:hypothetical protein
MRQVLKHLESPFGFIKGFQMEQNAKSRAEDRAKQAEENKSKTLTDWELTPEMQ